MDTFAQSEPEIGAGGRNCPSNSSFRASAECPDRRRDEHHADDEGDDNPGRLEPGCFTSDSRIPGTRSRPTVSPNDTPIPETRIRSRPMGLNALPSTSSMPPVMYETRTTRRRSAIDVSPSAAQRAPARSHQRGGSRSCRRRQPCGLVQRSTLRRLKSTSRECRQGWRRARDPRLREPCRRPHTQRWRSRPP